MKQRIRKMSKGKMTDGQKINVADHMEMLCEECQLYAVKFFIWNTEPEQLEVVLKEALGTLPGKASTEGYLNSLRKVLTSMQHCDLKNILSQIELILLGPCKSEACQETCEEFWSKR